MMVSPWNRTGTEEARKAQQRAQAEQQRAEAAEAELVRLRALLAQQTADKTNPPE